MFISKAEKTQITDDIKLIKATLDQMNNEIRVLVAQITNTRDMLKPNPEPKKPAPKKVAAKKPKQFTLSQIQVEAMKQAGVWNNQEKRKQVIAKYMQEEQLREQENKRARQREYNRRHQAKKQLEKMNANSVSTESK